LDCFVSDLREFCVKNEISEGLNKNLNHLIFIGREFLINCTRFFEIYKPSFCAEVNEIFSNRLLSLDFFVSFFDKAKNENKYFTL
jgi:hypothetical protein